MKIILAGATGFIGKQLVRKLWEDQHAVVVLTRNLERARKIFGEFAMFGEWDSKSLRGWAKLFEGADAVINLAGEPIASRRWTRSQKERITDSRIDSTKAIVAAMAHCTNRPRTLINASAVGFYGNVPEGNVDESHTSSDDFLGRLCSAWENEAAEAEKLNARVVRLRIGLVLGNNGGALQKMMIPFKLFVGGPLGSGRQWFPWIHQADLINIIHFALHTPGLSGAVNATSPNPVIMNDFCTTLGSVLHRPSWMPVPNFLLKWAVGELAESLLGGQKAIPKKLQQSGYAFAYPDLKDALKNICG